MAKGSRSWTRWRNDRQRKLKARLKKQAEERAEQRKARKS